jgi:hypothetical protein
MRHFTLLVKAILMIVLFLTVPGLAGQAASSAGTTWFVTAGGSSDCSDWAHACSLPTALAGAATGDEIWAVAGVYVPPFSGDRGAGFMLEPGVAVYGGFEGNEATRAARDPLAHLTILSGDFTGDDSQHPVITDLTTVTGNTNNSYHVVYGAQDARLDGFTITAGYAEGLGELGQGAGLYNTAAGLILANLVFRGNYAKDGGGLYNANGTISLIDVDFLSNYAVNAGGGFHNSQGGFNLWRGDIEDNHTGASGTGGGMYNSSAFANLVDVVFTGNTANNGGGLYNDGADPSLERITFFENEAVVGGGLFNNYSDPLMKDITFRHNRATSDGGGLYNDHSSPHLTNVSFLDNPAAHSGGGIVNFSSSPSLVNVTFSGNWITNPANGYGGGIYNGASSSPLLYHVTLSGNSATYGGGIYNDSSSPQIRNSILWDNYAPNGAQIYDIGGSSLVSDSVVEGGFPGGTNIHTGNPLLSSYHDYGGHTLVMPIAPGSSAIDQADPFFCPAADQRELPRPYDGDGVPGAACDIGAFEYGFWQRFMPLILKYEITDTS